MLCLPTEILRDIVDSLPHSKDVTAVVHTCGQLNRATSDKLYQDIKLHIGNHYDLELGTERIMPLAVALFQGDLTLRNSIQTIRITIPNTCQLF